MPRLNCKPLPPLSEGDIERFWSKVDVCGSQSCWAWIAAQTQSGYGVFTVSSGGPFRSVQVMAHRVAYLIGIGSDPMGMLVCHRCDNPPCCNPSHLFLGTDKDNAEDRERKGRGVAFMRLHPERAAKGSRCRSAKLTEQSAALAVEWYNGGMPRREITGRLGVKVNAIAALVNRKTWAWLGLEVVHPASVEYPLISLAKQGERHPQCKLKQDQVVEIRRMKQSGGVTEKQLSAIFSVSRSTINNVIRRKSWSWLS